MAESKVIPTSTIITRTNSGSPNLSVFTFYNEGGLHILQSIVENITGSILGTNFREGDLVFLMKNYPTEIFAEINSDGELIVYSQPGEVYSIDSNGNLIGEIL